MKRILSLALTVCFLTVVFLSAGCAESVKEPSVAGTFYPADKKELKEMLDDFLSNAEKRQHDGKLVAIISPHAGFRFSGQVAAYGYKQIQGSDINKVILIGPEPSCGIQRRVCLHKGELQDPLGDVRIDEKRATDCSMRSRT